MVKLNGLIGILRKPLAARISIIALVFLSTCLLFKSGALEFLELRVYDSLLRLQSPTTTIPRIAVINISEEDIRQLSRWPVSDATLAEVLSRLGTFQPRVIGVDIYRDLPVPPGHETLVTLLQQNQNIIAAMKFGAEGLVGVRPPPALENTAQFGFTDMLQDRDGLVRRGLLFLDDGKTVAFSFALRLAMVYLQKEGITPVSDPQNPEHIRLGSTTIMPFEGNFGGYVSADAQGYQFPLDVCGHSKAVPRYTLAQIRSGKIRAADFEDRIVLIGVSAESVKDFFLTPCSGNSGAEQRVSGVLLHAAITDQLLRTALGGTAPLKSVSDTWEILWILLWSLGGGLISQLPNSYLKFAMAQVGGLSLLGLVTTLLFMNGTWLIAATPALAWLTSSALAAAYKASREKKDRALLMNLFSKHVAPEIADDIWRKREQFFAEGRPLPQKTTATIMFTDVQGFTTLAEKLDPPALFDWLNDYLAGITPLVADNGGVVIRFIGDAILAGFGVPVPSKTEDEIRRDAVNAVRCALSMEDNLIELNARWQEQGLPAVGMRIGLFTGPLVTGSLGDRERMEYTVHGDTVNTAARLESFDKSQFVPDPYQQPCRILIGDATLQYLGDQFRTEPVGKVQLKGKKNPVGIFRVVGTNHTYPITQ